MTESELCFHHLEWPPAGTSVAGPIVWLRGWVHGRAELVFTDVRAVAPTGVHLGILGLPRADLARHFNAPRAWLPAEYLIGVPLPAGASEVTIEGNDEFGRWHLLQRLTLNVAPNGAASPRIEGEVVSRPGGSWTQRGPHLPWHGHLDEPRATPVVRAGQLEIFGWLLHETAPVQRVFSTLDGLTYHVAESGLTDDSLAAKVPQHAAARHARLRGTVEVPVTLATPAGLRVYAELADGSVHLCFAHRVEPEFLAAVPATVATTLPQENRSLAPLPSGRPRRLLVVVRTLAPDDATWRALDVARHLTASGRWVVRVIASEDGPLHAAFEQSGSPVQLVDPLDYFTAATPAATTAALHALGRQIWWRHLDALALFDPASTWAERLAAEHHLTVFPDPATTLLWAAPEPQFTFAPSGGVFAPIRGLAVHGGGGLLAAWELLQRRHATTVGERALVIGDVRATPEEQRFKASAALNFAPTGPRATVRVEATAGEAPQAVAALICPADTAPPVRALLSALANGVPVIATPVPALVRAFGPNEVTWVPTGNPLALAHAIADTLANPSARDRRVSAARRIAQAQFAPGPQLARWQCQLESALVR